MIEKGWDLFSPTEGKFRITEVWRKVWENSKQGLDSHLWVGEKDERESKKGVF